MGYVVEAIIDTLRTLPILLAVLMIIEALEHRFSSRLQRGLSGIGRLGPAIGAGIGVLPQCGGAVVASELYSAGTLTLGTLMAVYLATSDEALPILATTPTKITTLVPLLFTKIVIATVAGYAVDLLSKRKLARAGGLAHSAASTADAGCYVSHAHDYAVTATPAYETRACLEGRLSLTAIAAHALRRGVRISAFLVVTTAVLNWLTGTVSAFPVSGALFARPSVQVLASASFGLIPSCAPSVAMTDLFVKGALSYPALIAGLCANAGAGLMVLLHESGWRTVLRVVALLFLVSVGAGLTLSLF